MSKRSWSLRSRRVVWIPAIVLLLASVTVRAADDAKTHYQRATAHFAVGEYHEAAIEYEEAFKLKQDPAILFNAAQSFRLAGDNQKALLLYNNIIKLYPNTQYARDSRERIEKLAQSGTSPPAAMPPEPIAPPPAAPPPITPIVPAAGTALPPAAIAPPATAPGASPLVVSSSPSPDESHPLYTRWWFWTTIGVVAAGAVVAVVALSSGGTTTVTNSWNNLPPVQAGVVR